MPFPVGLTLITVSGTVAEYPNGGVTSGSITFTSPTWLTSSVDDAVVPQFAKTVTLAADGTFTVNLPATNDPGWTPQGWAYDVRIAVGGLVFRASLSLPYDGGAVNVADVLAPTAPVPGQSYVLLSSRGAPNGVASLDGSGLVPLAQVDPLVSGRYRASDQGFAAWTFDVEDVQASTVLPLGGLSHVVRFRALTSVISNLHFHVVTGGSGLTANQCFATLHNDAGAQLGAGAITGDLSPASSAGWGSGGFKTCPLQVAQAVTPYAWYRVRFWGNGTTGPALSRKVNSASALLNALLAAANSRYSTADTGLTTAGSAPSNIGAQTGAATAWWVGAS
jgi:hypothetical protein